jgi:hypothetical protein
MKFKQASQLRAAANHSLRAVSASLQAHFSQRGLAHLPLPQGEGRGEGEGAVLPALLVRGGRNGFTLAEVLAALAFMAIVIPVAVNGLRVANLAGQVGERKAVAARVAERVLNEWTVTGASQTPSQNGTVQEGVGQYRWSIRTEPWNQDTMRLVTVQVVYAVQGQDYDVRISTLMGNSTR